MATVDQPDAIPMFVAEDRVFIDNNNCAWIVVHKTAGGESAQAVANFFAEDPQEASTHYIIGQDGAIVQCVLEKDGAAGNCCQFPGHAAYLPANVNMNNWTISIEHVDPSTNNSTSLTAAQQAASFKLIRDICTRHNIPMRSGDASGGIIGHFDIDPVNKARCPGNYPWSDLWNYLKEEETPVPTTINLTMPVVAGYFQQGAGEQWQCTKNAFHVQGQILEYYQRLGGGTPDAEYCGLSVLGLPTSNEIAIVNAPAGYVEQIFERGIVRFCPGFAAGFGPGPGVVGPCYQAFISTAQIPSTLQTEINVLEAKLKQISQIAQ
jgi:N-acetyl-anhydromuramyl-L-alanine amidase AmpD